MINIRKYAIGVCSIFIYFKKSIAVSFTHLEDFREETVHHILLYIFFKSLCTMNYNILYKIQVFPVVQVIQCSI